MIIDCHYHLDSSMVPLPELLRSMDRHGIARVALIPRLNPPLFINPVLAKLALPVFRRGLHRSQGWLHRAMTAIYQSNLKADGTVDILGTRYEVFPRPPNDEVVAAVEAHPDRFYGWVFINPAGPEDPIPVIQNCLTRPGLIGVKAHPYWHHYPVRRLEAAAAWCQEHGKPMLIHLGAGENGDFRFLPERFPRLKIIYAHAGIPESAAVCALARSNPNVFVDLSSSSYVDLHTARDAVRRAGPGQCLFGSDGPYFHVDAQHFDFGYFRRLLDKIGLSSADRERVLANNFLGLLGR
jgi:predicted TIM-barrel fold metal-dependent hydrolase